jgi:hypothetical protein
MKNYPRLFAVVWSCNHCWYLQSFKVSGQHYSSLAITPGKKLLLPIVLGVPPKVEPAMAVCRYSRERTTGKYVSHNAGYNRCTLVGGLRVTWDYSKSWSRGNSIAELGAGWVIGVRISAQPGATPCDSLSLLVLGPALCGPVGLWGSLELDTAARLRSWAFIAIECRVRNCAELYFHHHPLHA